MKDAVEYYVHSSRYDPNDRCQSINDLGTALGIRIPSVTEHTDSTLWLPSTLTQEQIDFAVEFLRQRGHTMRKSWTGKD